MVEAIQGKEKTFWEEEYKYRKLSNYERLCIFFDRIKIPLPKSLEERYRDEINFCHLRVTPNGVFLTSIVVPLLIFFFLSFTFYLFHILSFGMVLLTILLCIIVFYYLFFYTSFLTKHYRTKAAAEMSSAIIYMCISLKINANLESAVAFAASNLSGPLGLDLKKLLWDLQTGKVLSVIAGLDELSNKWKSESDEFVDALSLLKSGVSEPSRMDRNIEEAIHIMLEGTKARMKKYALDMRTPLKLLNTFGILLPLLLLIFLPVLVIFVPELARPELFAFSYIILLPLIIYLFLSQYCFTKPYSYHQVEIKNLEEFKKQQFNAIFIVFGLALPLVTFFLFKLSTIRVLFSTEQFLYSFFVVLTLSLSVVVYSFLTSFKNLKKNEEILKIESELPTVLFQLALISSVDKPIEKSIEDLYPRIKTLKISKIFSDILYNIKTFGMTLESAIFDKKVGAILSYPSKIISISFEILVDISKRGILFLSTSLKSMSEFLKDADEVDKATNEILSETLSDMQIQALVFAPLSAGIVVGLTAMIMYVFTFFGQSIQEMNVFFEKTGLGNTGMMAFSFLLNIGKGIPFHFLQIIVGIYMIEIVTIITFFLGEINYGEDEVSKLYNLGKTMLIAIIIYSVVVCSLYFGISSVIKLSELGALV